MVRMRTMLCGLTTTFLISACSEDSPLEPETAVAPEIAMSGSSLKIVDGPVPYYADLSSGFVVADDGWVAIVFKRSPECVPADFNLLARLDFSLFAPGGPECPMVVSGVQLFGNPSDPMMGVPPRQEHYTGSAVPIWFAPMAVFEAATADGDLKIGELGALSGLVKGVASVFNQSIRNSDAATQGSGRRPGSSSTVARGTLEDGRSFHLHVAEKFQPGAGNTILHVNITIM